MPGAASITPGPPHGETNRHLQQAFKLALSLVLFYWLALGMNWDQIKYGGLAITIISLGTTGATIEKGILRFVGTIVGVSIGLLILSLFNHDRWATVFALAVYIGFIGYFMQSSRYPYAWYAAGFIPLVVWGDTYPHFESAFYFGTFRWLETTAGILIYTIVDLVLWPRSSGDPLYQQGRELWAEVQTQLKNLRGQLDRNPSTAKNPDLREQLAATLSKTLATAQQAYLDSPKVNARKTVWEVWRRDVRSLVDDLELWRETIDETRQLNLDRLVDGLGPEMDKLQRRLQRISDLWDACQADSPAPSGDDASLMETINLDLKRPALAELTQFDRAALTNFLRQLEMLDQTSRELLRTLRVLAGLEKVGLEKVSGTNSTKHPKGRSGYWFLTPFPGPFPGPDDLSQHDRWNPSRLHKALFPPVTLICGFLFWVFVYPPPGQLVPMVAAILALVIVRTPMPPLAAAKLGLLSIFLVVAPVYFLVMPALDTGFGLLSLIFIYSFVFGYLGGRSPALKSGPIIFFLMMTGLSNQQRYSFEALVDGALLVLLASVILAAVSLLFFPKSART